MVDSENENTTDYTTDDGKRRRGSDEGEDAFKRSKKVMRTPKRSDQKSENMLVKMMNMLTDLSTDMKEVKLKQDKHIDDMEFLYREIQELRKEQSEYKKEVERLRQINEHAIKEIDHLKEESSSIKERLEKLEANKRKNNIILQGFTVDDNTQESLRDAVEKFFVKELGIVIKIRSARGITDKMCKVELNNADDKIKIMQNKSKLKNLTKRVYINNDLTKEERIIESKIRIKAKEEKAKGNSTKIRHQKLIVNNVIWKWSKDKGELVKTENDNPKN